MVKENLIFNNLILLGAGKSSRFNKGDDTFVANKNSISEDSVNKGSINQDTVSKVKKQFFYWTVFLYFYTVWLLLLIVVILRKLF